MGPGTGGPPKTDGPGLARGNPTGVEEALLLGAPLILGGLAAGYGSEVARDHYRIHKKEGKKLEKRVKRTLKGFTPNPDPVDKAAAIFEDFHNYEPTSIKDLKFPVPESLTHLGRFSAIGYVSPKAIDQPKGEGEPQPLVKYIHEWKENSRSFKRGGVYYDPKSKWLYAIAPAKVTPRGIEDA